MFLTVYQTDSTDPLTVPIRLHFAVRLNIEPQEIQYELAAKSKAKNEDFEFQKTFTVHLRDIAFK